MYLIIPCYFSINYLEPSLLASPPKTNAEVEEMINDNKDQSVLYWNFKGLTDDDAATIAYNLLKDNKVSHSLEVKFKCIIFLFFDEKEHSLH